MKAFVGSDSAVAIVDLGISNITSLINGVSEVGFDPCPLSDPTELSKFSRMIFPGHGNFFRASALLSSSGWDESVKAFAKSGKPILGICLGMQLMASTGEENGHSFGLDLIPGHVKKIDSAGLRTPHVGWNSVTQLRSHKIFNTIRQGCDFYFSHNYVFEPKNQSAVLCETHYGSSFCSTCSFENIVGVQFHPEKSQRNGLSVLTEFMNWDGN